MSASILELDANQCPGAQWNYVAGGKRIWLHHHLSRNWRDNIVVDAREAGEEDSLEQHHNEAAALGDHDSTIIMGSQLQIFLKEASSHVYDSRINPLLVFLLLIPHPHHHHRHRRETEVEEDGRDDHNSSSGYGSIHIIFILKLAFVYSYLYFYFYS